MKSNEKNEAKFISENITLEEPLKYSKDKESTKEDLKVLDGLEYYKTNPPLEIPTFRN